MIRSPIGDKCTVRILQLEEKTGFLCMIWKLLESLQGSLMVLSPQQEDAALAGRQSWPAFRASVLAVTRLVRNWSLRKSTNRQARKHCLNRGNTSALNSRRRHQVFKEWKRIFFFFFFWRSLKHTKTATESQRKNHLRMKPRVAPEHGLDLGASGFAKAEGALLCRAKICEAVVGRLNKGTWTSSARQSTS